MRVRGSTTLLLLMLASASTACTRLTPYYGAGLPIAPPLVASQVDHRLLLIGDAGDADPAGEPALDLLGRQARLLPDRTTVVFLGDNIYERGMPEAGKPVALDEAAQAANVVLLNIFNSRLEAERRLNAQIDTVRGTKVPAIFIPGNHDWDPFDLLGWKRVLEQENYLLAAAAGGVDVRMVPGGGCPGPISLPLGTTGTLIVLDTQWWFENETLGKPQPDNNPTHCPITTETEVLDALTSELAAAAKQGRWAVVAGHHPLNSEGPHGGFVDAYTHLFPLRFLRHYIPWYAQWIPLPVLGSMAVVARQNFSPSNQDFSNAENERFRRRLRAAMADSEKRDAPVLAYAAGHDHSLQVFRSRTGPRYTMVSGLGNLSRGSEVGTADNTLFAHANPRHPGFMQVDFLRGGAVRLSVLEANADKPDDAVESFAMMLAQSDAPRGARPATKQDGVWSRMRQRLKSAWTRPAPDK